MFVMIWQYWKSGTEEAKNLDIEKIYFISYSNDSFYQCILLIKNYIDIFTVGNVLLKIS